SVSITIEEEGLKVTETVTETSTHTLTLTVTEPVGDHDLQRPRAITADDAATVSGTISIPEDGSRRAKRRTGIDEWQLPVVLRQLHRGVAERRLRGDLEGDAIGVVGEPHRERARRPAGLGGEVPGRAIRLAGEAHCAAVAERRADRLLADVGDVDA